MNWAKVRLVACLVACAGVACSGSQVAGGGDGGSDAASDGGGSSGTSSGSSGSSGDGGSSSSSSGTSGASGNPGDAGKIICGAHTATPSGANGNCKVDDTVSCGRSGGVNDNYQVNCFCNAGVKNECDCIINNTSFLTAHVTGVCPTCDQGIMMDAYKACGFPY